MWYLIMFFRHVYSYLIDKQMVFFRYLFCRHDYHCICYNKGERCCECQVYASESIPDKQVMEYRQSER